MVYSRVPAVKCGSSAVAVLIKKKKECKNKILDYQWASSITVKFGLKFLKITFTIIGVYCVSRGTEW